ncbi:HNH endonuclease [Brachybacterium halotolerans subsp. kimchii]|uniref:HNH endonuclease n=1 Tax=Brachybacterium halotolerans TaxID=2795215 RepID=UPI001E2DF944|nr:HNH endonuclease [Brachybacterium halotolerans]UEJ82484.1 HNH endonuclease [Brachybacterium halotolerans subsp. kimchii]
MTHTATPLPQHAARAAHALALLESAASLVERAEEILSEVDADASESEGSFTDDVPTPAGTSALSLPEALLDAVAVSERLRSRTDAVHMRASVAFRDARIAQQRDDGIPREAIGKGLAHELALARHASPARTGNQLALDRVIVETLPRTLGLLARGEISRWSADEVAKAVLCLDDEDRARVDDSVAEHLPEVSPRRAGGMARARADEIDQRAALARHEREVGERHVSIRPVSDAVVRVSALLPLVQGVAVYKALDDAASSARAAGVEGTRGQHMADALFRRTTGLERPEDVDVEIQLLMTDGSLLAGGEDTAWVEGHPMPAAIARRLALAATQGSGNAKDPESPDPQLPADPARFIRRLYTDPVSGRLRDADAGRRRFTGSERRFVEMADQHCRTPFCDARARHIDHVVRHADGGETVVANGVARCEGCNYLMELPGWSGTLEDAEQCGSGPPHAPPARAPSRAYEITTPMGRSYASSAPPLRRALRGDGDSHRDVDPSRDVVPHRTPPASVFMLPAFAPDEFPVDEQEGDVERMIELDPISSARLIEFADHIAGTVDPFEEHGAVA